MFGPKFLYLFTYLLIMYVCVCALMHVGVRGHLPEVSVHFIQKCNLLLLLLLLFGRPDLSFLPAHSPVSAHHLPQRALLDLRGFWRVEFMQSGLPIKHFDQLSHLQTFNSYQQQYIQYRQTLALSPPLTQILMYFHRFCLWVWVYEEWAHQNPLKFGTCRMLMVRLH